MFRALLFALALGCPISLPAAEVTVFAAASLTDALKEVGTQFEKETGTRVMFNFAASNTLARQIEEGAAADIFFSADDAQMQRLADKNHLIAETRRNLLTNTLVVIAPAENNLEIGSAAELAEKTARIALADPKMVPAGVYARGYLMRAGVWEKIAPKVIPVENVRAAAAAVEAGNVEAGIVYKTDALVSKRVRVIFEVPAAEAPEVNYPVALLREAPNRAAAEMFLRYVSADKAAEVFRRFGFIVRR